MGKVVKYLFYGLSFGMVTVPNFCGKSGLKRSPPSYDLIHDYSKSVEPVPISKESSDSSPSSSSTRLSLSGSEASDEESMSFFSKIGVPQERSHSISTIVKTQANKSVSISLGAALVATSKRPSLRVQIPQHELDEKDRPIQIAKAY